MTTVSSTSSSATTSSSSASSVGSISSIGLGSGIDVESIITNLKKVETAQLTPLKAAAELTSTRISAYANVKSLVSTLSDAAAKLADSSSTGVWRANAVTSSNTAAVTATTAGGATAGSYDVTVSQLARVQTVASSAVSSGTTLGSGTLTFTVGTWTTDSDGKATDFTAGSAAAVSVDIGSSDDSSLAGIASKINAAGAGVTASVITDSSGQRLVFRSSTTGREAGFKVEASGDSGIQSLAFDATSSTKSFQLGQDTQATVNGVSVTSGSRTLTDVVPGVTLKLSQVTTTPASVEVKADTDAMTKAVQSFVDAYNAVNTLLTTSTKYDATSKVAGTLQADGTAVNMRNMLRTLVTSSTGSGTLTRLSDIGITTSTDGTLALGSTKLATALAQPDNVKALFATYSTDSTASGIGVKIKTAARSMLAFDGAFASKTASLNKVLSNNAKDQDRVNDRWSASETRLRATYTALDAKMSTLTALNTYVSQQVAAWNKSTG